MNSDDQFLTVREVAMHFRVSCETVRTWIRTGKLQALNLSASGKLPFYRILASSLSTIGTVQGQTKSTNPALVDVQEFI